MRHTAALALILLITPAAWAGGEPTFSEIRSLVERALTERDAATWAAKLEAQPLPENRTLLIQRLLVLGHAGHHDAMREVVSALAEHRSMIGRSGLESCAAFVLWRRDLELSKYCLELIPITNNATNPFFKQFEEATSAEEVAAWLGVQVEAHPEWYQRWLKYRKKIGTEREILDELAGVFERDPGNLEALRRYRWAASITDTPVDPVWVKETARPRTSSDRFFFGRAFVRGWPDLAIHFFEQSLAAPFTAEDAQAIHRWLSSRRSAPVPEQDFEPVLRDEAKSALMVVYREQGETAKAQALLEELAAKYPDGLPRRGLEGFAGQTQSQSGARVIEKRYRDAEEKNEESVAYWLSRGGYFLGRKEMAEAEAAFKKALELAPGQDGDRRDAVNGYFGYLFRTKGRAAAIRFRYEELVRADPTSFHAEHQVRLLLRNRKRNELSAVTGPADEVLWRLLTQRKRWDHLEQTLILFILDESKDAPAVGRKTIARAEALAREAHPSRARILGEVMMRIGHSGSAKWLTDAADRYEEPGRQTATWFRLFLLHLYRDDYQAAEKIWPRVAAYHEARDHAHWFTRMAVAAARSGAKADAMRLWRQRTDLDRQSLEGVNQMVKAGLRVELLAFYEELLAADSDSAGLTLIVESLKSSH